MPGFSWKKSKELLKEGEKDRICCLLLTCINQIKPTGADFAIAAEEFGAAVGGFTKMYQTTIKKLKDANAYAGTGEDGDHTSTGPEDGAATPKAKKYATLHKRKPSSGADDDGDSPVKKARTPRKKKGVVKEEVEEDDDAEAAAQLHSEADTEMGV